ncbi:MAG: type II secretion system protein GspD [Alphaproteobacteria bacterium]|nr:type II secretion system protein GspD [Alphaproteobacteria bacterium]
MVSLRRTAIAAASAMMVIGATVPGTTAATDIPWKDVTWEHTSVDEDIKDVLRALLSADGLQVIFRPGVKGPVSTHISSMPLRAAFTMLMTENNLEYSYDPGTKMVTILQGGAKGEMSQDFVSLGLVNPDDLVGAMKDFGLGGNIKINKGTNTALLKGTPDQVKLLKDLITDMATSAGKVAADRAKGNTSSSEVTKAAAEAARAEVEAANAAAAAKAESERAFRENFLNQEIKIIPLQFATVAATTKKFYDQSVTVPGIAETVNNLLGGDIKSMTKDMPKEQAEKIQEIASSLTFARPMVSTDARTNSVLVRGTPEAIRKVEAIVKQLDQAVPMIEIEVMIVQLKANKESSLGISWAASQSVDSNDGMKTVGISQGMGTPSTAGTSLGSVAALSALPILANTLPTSANAGTSATAGFVLNSNRSFLQTQLNMLATNGDSQTIASPHLVTMNNVQAKFAQQDSFSIAITGTTGGAGTLQTVNAGITVDITPSVVLSPDPAVKPLVRLNLTTTNTAPSLTSNSTVEVTGSTVTTDVLVPDGTTFVLGGIKDDFRTKNSEGVPGLHDIPVLGALFGTDVDSNRLDETVYFITPKIVRPNEIAQTDGAARRYMQSRSLSPSAAGDELRRSASVPPRLEVHPDE